MDEHMAREQAKLDAVAPRLYCELCRKEFIGLSHRHFVGGKLTYEATAALVSRALDAPQDTFALPGEVSK